MAFYSDNMDEDELNPNGQPQTGPQSGMLGTGGGMAPSAAGAPKPLAPDRSSNFVGIKQYIDANKKQAGKLGDQTAGVIGQSAQGARDAVSSLNQEAQNTIKPVSQLSGDVSNKLSNAAETLSSDERKTIKDTASAQYKGPQNAMGLSGYQAAADKTNKAVQNLNAANTEEGRMGLISQVNAKPRTQGMNVFDNALLQAGGGRERLQQAISANQDVKGGLDAASQAIQSQIGRADDPNTPDVDESSGAIGETNKAQADAYGKIQSALSNWTQGFQPKVGQAQQDLVDWQNKVSADISDDQYNLAGDVLSATGLKAGDRLFGLNLSDYLNSLNASNITAANVASAEDYARYGALADLAGVANPILDQANVSQAGTAPKRENLINSTKLLADREAAEQAFNDLAQTTSLAGSSYLYETPVRFSQLVDDYLQNGISGARGGLASSGDIERYNYSQHSGEMNAAAKNALANAIKNWLESKRYNTQIGSSDSAPVPINASIPKART